MSSPLFRNLDNYDRRRAKPGGSGAPALPAFTALASSPLVLAPFRPELRLKLGQRLEQLVKALGPEPAADVPAYLRELAEPDMGGKPGWLQDSYRFLAPPSKKVGMKIEEDAHVLLQAIIAPPYKKTSDKKSGSFDWPLKKTVEEKDSLVNNLKVLLNELFGEGKSSNATAAGVEEQEGALAEAEQIPQEAASEGPDAAASEGKLAGEGSQAGKGASEAAGEGEEDPTD